MVSPMQKARKFVSVLKSVNTTIKKRHLQRRTLLEYMVCFTKAAGVKTFTITKLTAVNWPGQKKTHQRN